MIFSFGNQEAYGNPLEPQVGIHVTSLLIEVEMRLIVTVLCRCGCFPGTSVTLKAMPGMETVCLTSNNKVSAWREKHEAEARITKAKYACVYMKTNCIQGWPEHKGLSHTFMAKNQMP